MKVKNVRFWFLPRTLLLLIVAGMVSSCQLNPFGGVKWESDFLLPVARTQATARDLVRDSTYLSTGSDGTLVFTYRDTLAELNLADLASFPDTTFSYSISLKSLDLSTAPFSQSITMADAARQLIDEGNFLGFLILANHGNIFPAVPPVPGLSSGQIVIDASGFFQYAEVASGNLELTIDNGFPLDIDSVILIIANASTPNQPLIADTFLTIPSGTSARRTYPLDNQVIESQLLAELINLNIAGGTAVPIDTTDNIRVSVQAKDLRARTATAVFPAQVLADTVRSNLYNFRENGLEITEVQFSGGEIRLSSISTVPDSVRFVYALPDAQDASGQVPQVDLKVKPAPQNGVIQQTEIQTLAGFTLAMDRGRPAFNVLRDRVRTELLYSGNLVTLDEEDSLRVNFGLQGLKPIAAKGYFGQSTFTYNGTERYNGFKGLGLQGLNLTAASAELVIENGLGMDASLTIRKLEARNTLTGQALPLAGAATLAGPVRIAGLVWPDTAGLSVTRIGFLANNSNINPLLNLQPDLLTYDVEFRTNPQVPAGYRENFATERSRLGAYVEVKAPLEGAISQWTINDTAEVSFGTVDVDQVGEVILKVRLANEFPLQALVTLHLLDASGAVVKSLLDDRPIQAAPQNAQGVSTGAAETLIDIPLSKEEILAVLNETAQLSLFARLSSAGAPNTPVKVLDRYQVEASLSAQIRYLIEP